MTDMNVDYAAIKSRQQTAWATGNYAVVGTTLQIVGESLCEALDLRAGSRVLDVAAGNGNATLAAARRFADVVSTDYVPSLLEVGRKRAEAEGLRVRFHEADAENLPFEDAAFDAVVSTFGVMFAPDQQKAASELLRVCRPGGKIGLANWTPEGLIGQLFKTVGKYVAPPPGVKPASLWGSQPHLLGLFGAQGAVQVTSRVFVFRYQSPQHFIDIFRTYYGPMNKTFAALDAQPERQAAFNQELLDLLARFNRSGDERLVAPADYLEVVIEKYR